MLRNLSKVSLGGLALITTMLFSSWASAGIITDITVPLNGNSSIISGEIDDAAQENELDSTTDAYGIVVDPAGVSTSVLALTFGASDVDTFAIWENGSALAGVSGVPGDTLTFAYDHNNTYQIRITGTSGDQYSFRLSSVPVPAAAWLFMSMIGGGAWLKRRRRKA